MTPKQIKDLVDQRSGGTRRATTASGGPPKVGNVAMAQPLSTRNAIAQFSDAIEAYEATRDYDPEEEGNPPPWAEDGELWDMAKNAVQAENPEYKETHAAATYLYKRMGGKINRDA
jgi:hypothetical protein